MTPVIEPAGGLYVGILAELDLSELASESFPFEVNPNRPTARYPTLTVRCGPPGAGNVTAAPPRCPDGPNKHVPCSRFNPALTVCSTEYLCIGFPATSIRRP